MLSFRETMGTLHSLLHQIPNPIHYHQTGALPHYHHSDHSGRSFFAHENHSHVHSMEDHVQGTPKGKHLKTEQKKKSGESEQEKSTKTTLFLSNTHDFHFAFAWIKNMLPGNSPFFSYLSPVPTGPPPEMEA